MNTYFLENKKSSKAFASSAHMPWNAPSGIYAIHNLFLSTVKVLIYARAFIRIITFHGEGDGHLLEARVLINYT